MDNQNPTDLLTDLDTVRVVKINDEKLTDAEFRRLQLVELSLLKELDRVCRKHKIRYTVFCGTLLGAVRHKGYIPWDDDADIAMLREDYEKFKKVAHEINSDIGFFQDHSTDPAYLWGYGKLRKTGTYHMRTGQEHIKCKNGVYIDIFPLDDIPQSLAGQLFQNIDCYICRKILWSKVGKRTEKGLKKAWFSLISHIPTDSVYKHLKRWERKSSAKQCNRVRCLTFPPFGTLYVKNPIRKRCGMPKKWFVRLKNYKFEDTVLIGTRDYDEILTYTYGDYMTPPPPEKRVPKVSFSRIEY